MTRQIIALLHLFYLTSRVAHTFTTRSASSISPCKHNRLSGPSSVVTLAVESAPSSSLPLSSENDGDSVPATTGITLKIAFDSQGGVADLSSEKSERFTCPESLDMVHRLRRVSDAVLVGRSTVEIDDCTLTVRRVPLLPVGQEISDETTQQKQQPVRVILDPQLELQLDQFKIANDGLATIVVHAMADASDTIGANDENEILNGQHIKTTNKFFPNVTFLGLRPTSEQDRSRLNTRQICDILAEEFDIHHIMVEGGPNTALQFLKDGTVDRAILVYAPISFKDPLLSNFSPTILEQAGLELTGSYTLGVDSIECYSRPNLPWPSTAISSWP